MTILKRKRIYNLKYNKFEVGRCVMPFLVTEPQKIDGTKLGYAVYSYHHSFFDHFDFSQYNQKLMIFKMKDSAFLEVESVLAEEHFKYQEASRSFVDKKLFSYVKNNPQYIEDSQKVTQFFSKLLTKEK